MLAAQTLVEDLTKAFASIDKDTVVPRTEQPLSWEETKPLRGMIAERWRTEEMKLK